MVKVKGFEFSLREFAGALGDFGPLNPFILGYVSILGLNPVGVFLAMGLTNIALGLTYKLPLPVEAMKAIGAVALRERWAPSQVYLSGILTGVTWLMLSLSGLVKRMARITPLVVIRGIQLGLMFILLRESISLMGSNMPLALFSMGLILVLARNRFLPSAIAVFSLGLLIVFLSNPNLSLEIRFQKPILLLPSIGDLTLSLLATVFAQIALTFSNAILATSLAVKERFPEKNIGEENLAINMGVINSLLPLIGGIPMCHGAGGFASQYFFGGRTGGAMIMEGLCEIVLALLLADSVTVVFEAFPLSIIGAMLLFASLELGKSAARLRGIDLALAIFIGLISLTINLAVGFLVGLVLSHFLKGRRFVK